MQAAGASSDRSGQRPTLRRPVTGRLVAGVAAGVAEHLRQPVRHVRLGFLLASALAGAGALAYVLLWALVPSEEAPRRAGDSGVPGGRADGVVSRGRRFVVDAETWTWLLWGTGLLAVGVVLILSRAGIGVPTPAVVPAAVALAGAVIAWTQLDAAERGRWIAGATGGTPGGAWRLAAGLALAATGIVLLAVTGSEASALRAAVLASGAVLAGVGLLLAPWALRLWRGLEEERAARVRATERADIAAHLHDSVLQTLALIQRRSADPAEVTRLARAQERELRSWLYGPSAAAEAGPEGDRDGAGAATLRAAVESAVAAVEDAHAVPVEVVVVGDRPLDTPAEALVQALREATLNAVRHGRPPVRVYVEASADGVEAWVADRGEGFDLAAVPADRLGVRESVLGRMERAGGSARVRPAPGGGTEVVLRLPAPATGTDARRVHP